MSASDITAAGGGVHLDHIAIAVRDLDAGVRYFERCLGFVLAETRQTQGETTAMRSAVMKRDGLTFVLLQGSDPASQVSRYVTRHGPGVHHIAIRVDGIDAAVDELREREVAFSTGVVRGPALSQTFTERDENSGIMLELLERGDGDGFEDQNVAQLFRDLERSEHV